MTKHWWAMLIDPGKCIGCGNCVRACEAENDVPPGSFRTWIERYHVDDYDLEHPQVDSPNGGHDGFPDIYKDGGKTFFVPKLCNHCSDSPCVQVCPWAPPSSRLTASCWWMKNTASVAGIAFKPVPTAAAS